MDGKESLKKITLAIAAFAAVGALTLVSSPAFAVTSSPRTLPAGDVLYVFGYGNAMPDVSTVDVSSGALTEVVAATGGVAGDFSGPSYNAADGLVYVIDWSISPYTLRAFDPQAKTLTAIAPITGQGSSFCDAYSMAIDAQGVAWVWDGTDKNLKTLDLTTGKCSDGVGTSLAAGDYIYGMAFAPNGTLFGAVYNTGDLCVLSTLNGSCTPQNPASQSTSPASLTFDSSGTAWVIDDSDSAELYSADIADVATTKARSGQLTFNTVAVYSEAIVVVPGNLAAASAPVLPNTGVDTSALGISALAALGALAIGVVFMTRRRVS